MKWEFSVTFDWCTFAAVSLSGVLEVVALPVPISKIIPVVLTSCHSEQDQAGHVQIRRSPRQSDRFREF